jgi:hypothetical protein
MMIMGVLEFFYLVGLFALSWVFYWFVVNIPGGRGVPKKLPRILHVGVPCLPVLYLQYYAITYARSVRQLGGDQFFGVSGQSRGGLCVGCVWFRFLGGYRGGVWKLLPIGVQPKGGKSNGYL